MSKDLFKSFFESERASGFILIACTLLSLTLANSSLGYGYVEFFEKEILSAASLPSTIIAWINDGVMAIFFLLVGLEIRRELHSGELSTGRSALLPVLAALGGMICPALIHFFFNSGLPTQRGFGIPMATDIAFALGVLSLAGKRVPAALKVFLTAVAIIDDLGAIIVIALFYTSSLAFEFLAAALLVWVILFIAGRKLLLSPWVYIIGGILIWYCLLRSGIHPTISGVLLAFAIPTKGGETSLCARFQSRLHLPVAFIIIPIFALANTAMVFPPKVAEVVSQPNGVGIVAGLIAGKPIGIFCISWLAVKLGWAGLSETINWKHLFAVSLLGGIGFTMSIFITDLAFHDGETAIASRISVLVGSACAALLGWLMLWYALKGETRLNNASMD